MKVPLLITASLLLTLFPASALAQGETNAASAFRIYSSSGKQVTLDEVISAMSNAEVVFLGETHNDPVAHRLELQLLQAATARYGAKSSSGRQVILSMEMFERDVQTELDEYLGGMILERQFLTDSRPWNNYQSDYRPLVEFARENKLSVVAANVPTRYANRVARLGRASLGELSKEAKAWFAPLPYGTASQEYAAKFARSMESMGGGHAGNSMQNFLDAQVLRDATMAYSIAQSLKSSNKALVLHVTGIFHVEGRMGVPEQLLAYRPQTRMIVLALLPSTELPKTDSESLGKLGDFVFLTEKP